MDCYTQMAMVDWYPSDGALMYEVMATTASEHNVTCKTSNASCDLEGLLCGQSYSVSVKALGQTCSSFAHMTGQLVTGNEALHAESPFPLNNVFLLIITLLGCLGFLVQDNMC